MVRGCRPAQGEVLGSFCVEAVFLASLEPTLKVVVQRWPRTWGTMAGSGSGFLCSGTWFLAQRVSLLLNKD